MPPGKIKHIGLAYSLGCGDCAINYSETKPVEAGVAVRVVGMPGTERINGESKLCWKSYRLA
jgi:hypothetical protein